MLLRKLLLSFEKSGRAASFTPLPPTPVRRERRRLRRRRGGTLARRSPRHLGPAPPRRLPRRGNRGHRAARIHRVALDATSALTSLRDTSECPRCPHRARLDGDVAGTGLRLDEHQDRGGTNSVADRRPACRSRVGRVSAEPGPPARQAGGLHRGRISGRAPDLGRTTPLGRPGRDLGRRRGAAPNRGHHAAAHRRVGI